MVPKLSINEISRSTFNTLFAVAIYLALIEPGEYSPINSIVTVPMVGVNVGVNVGVLVKVAVGVTVDDGV